MTAVLAAERLSFIYPATAAARAPAPVIVDLSCEVHAGEWVVLLGATGSGKSTLCSILLGLIPEMTGGSLSGRIILASGQSIGYVFQDAEAQLFNMTVEDEVAFGLETSGLSRAAMQLRVREWLAWARLDGLGARAPWQLSGGQKKRLALASVLAMSPSVLVLDEPTAGLDPQGVSEVCESLNDLRRRGQHTLLIATSDVELSTRYADRVLVLEAGRIAQAGPLQRLWSIADAPAMHVGVPQIVALAHQLQAEGGEAGFVTLDEAAATLALAGSAMQRFTPATSDAIAPAVDHAPMEYASADTFATSPASPQQAGNQSPGLSLSPPAIAVESISFRYLEAGYALRDVSFTVQGGSFVAIVGANGSGKTTLAKHLNGLLRPERGRVLVDGADIARRTTAQLAQRVGYVFQNPDHQLFAASVCEELAFGLHNLALPKDVIPQRIAGALAAFDLEPLAEMPPATLGYGARRLVTLAAIWAMAPAVWVMDEPTTGLDARHADRVLRAARDAQARGATIIFISHDIPRVAAHAERVLVMRNGSVIADAAPREIFGDAALLRAARLSAPPVTELARRLGWSAAPLTVDEWLLLYHPSAQKPAQ
jgi:energy-coupling factor transport system ATP-binding protein